mgnify:CR=1 FL=1
MRNKLFFLITLISVFVLMLVACGSSDNKMSTNSNESVEDVTNSDAGENVANDSEGYDAAEIAENGDSMEASSVNEEIKETLIAAGVYGLDKGQEYSVQFKGEEFEFEHLGCNRTEVSNYLAAEGPNNMNVYVQFNFDEDGTLMYHNGGVDVMNIGEENGYHSDRDELEENNFIAIEENARIVYGEVPVYLDGEIDNEMEMLTFYLNCGNQ